MQNYFLELMNQQVVLQKSKLIMVFLAEPLPQTVVWVLYSFHITCLENTTAAKGKKILHRAHLWLDRKQYKGTS